MNKKIRNMGMLMAPSAINSEKISPHTTPRQDKKFEYSDVSRFGSYGRKYPHLGFLASHFNLFQLIRKFVKFQEDGKIDF
jgi:hypothetical protein